MSKKIIVNEGDKYGRLTIVKEGKVSFSDLCRMLNIKYDWALKRFNKGIEPSIIFKTEDVKRLEMGEWV